MIDFQSVTTLEIIQTIVVSAILFSAIKIIIQDYKKSQAVREK